jgi:deoxyribodipyrimidine photo-lyase
MNIDRIEIKGDASNNNEYILYIMSSSFRTHNNHSLEHALELVHSTKKPLKIVLFKEDEDNPRNNEFFIQGIANYDEVLSPISDDISVHKMYNEDIKETISKAYHMVKDRAYLNRDKEVEESMVSLALEHNVGVSIVESDVYVPVRSASQKEEYAASTIRKKIMSRLEAYHDPIQTTLLWFDGEAQALEVLMDFITEKLDHYTERNDPSKNYVSGLSPYLKYGFISPLTVYDEVIYFEGEATESFIEELIVRRELAYNFVFYNPLYDTFKGITYEWAYKTMENHLMDHREYLYTKEDYITFNTHDKYFNAAMKQMVLSGTMHGYMRMYWAKKIIEWSRTYEEAYETAIGLNNYYFLDGNTPNGYTGVAWCFGKHDRAWTERPIFGKLRYMNSNGLKRKFDIEEYVRQMEELE